MKHLLYKQACVVRPAQVKIVDFGSAVISHAGAGRPGGFTQPLVGGAMSCTPAFRSPESLQAGYKPNFEVRSEPDRQTLTSAHLGLF